MNSTDIPHYRDRFSNCNPNGNAIDVKRKKKKKKMMKKKLLMGRMRLIWAYEMDYNIQSTVLSVGVFFFPFDLNLLNITRLFSLFDPF